MIALLQKTDSLLRGSRVAGDTPGTPPTTWMLVMLVVVYAPLYGLAMGSYRFDGPERLLQMLYSALKMSLLLFGTAIVCVPAFFVLNTILGLRDGFARAIHAILAGQATLSITLASLLFVIRFFYFSSVGYDLALLLNAAMFTVAAVAAQIVMFRYYRPLIQENQRHRTMLYAWIALYSFVGIQMGWMLRPFVGSPGLPVSFFREGAFTNAYVVVGRLIAGVFVSS